MEQLTGSKLRKEYDKAVYCHPVYLAYRQRISCEMLGWVNCNWNQDCWEKCHRYADDTTLMAESKEELKSLLMKVKEEGEKSWLKTQHSKSKDCGIQSHHFMTNRWGNSRNSDRLYFLGLQKSLQTVTTAMKLIDSCVLKSRGITLPTNVHIVKTMVLPVVVYGC